MKNHPKFPDDLRAKNETPIADGLEAVGSGGCVRQKCEGRGAYELPSPFVAERDALLFEWGAKNRGDRNWEKGCPFSRCIQSLLRHVTKYLQRTPDDDHDDNLAAIRFWAGALMHYEKMIELGILPESLDDLPRYERLLDYGQVFTHTMDQAATTSQIDEGASEDTAIEKMIEDAMNSVPSSADRVEAAVARIQEREDIARGDRAVRVDDFMVPPDACPRRHTYVDLQDELMEEDAVEARGMPSEEDQTNTRLNIYVSGPMTNGLTTSPERTVVNFEMGQAVGRAIQAKGHAVFTPHNYMVDCNRRGYEDFMEIDLSIIEHWADAVFLIDNSSGADREVAFAKELGLRVFRSLGEIWEYNKKG